MSDIHSPEVDANIPRFERWLGVGLAAFVPAVATVFAPDALHMPLIIATAVLVATAFWLLIRQGRAQATEAATSRERS